MLRSRLVPALVVATAGFLLVHAAISGYDHDEIVHLHSAWLIWSGERPYADFLAQHHPAAAYLLAPLAHALDGHPHALVFAARFLDLLLLAVTLLAFHRMARRLVRDPRWAAWAVLLLGGSFFFLRNSMEVRPDPWMCALAAVALWQWTTYLRGGSLAAAAWAGLALGGSITFLQKAFAFAALVAIGTALWLGRDGGNWRRAARGGAVLAACAAIPVGAMAILVYRAGFFRDFWFWNYTFNRYFYLKTHFTGPSAWAVTGVAVAENPLLWLAGFAGLAIALRRRLRVEPEIAIATLVVCGLLASLFQSRWPFSHNLLLLQPCLALLAVGPLERAVEAPRTRTAVLVVLTLLTVKVGVMSLVYTEGGRSAEVQQRLLAVTGPGDPLAVTPPYHPIFRRDAFFFWYVPQYNVVAYLACCREVGCPQGKVGRDLRAWVTAPPRFVYVPADEPSWAPYGFAEHRSDYRLEPDGALWKRRTRNEQADGPPSVTVSHPAE